MRFFFPISCYFLADFECIYLCASTEICYIDKCYINVVIKSNAVPGTLCKTVIQTNCYTDKLLYIQTVIHTNCYIDKLKQIVKQTNNNTGKVLYTQTVIHTNCYADKLLYSRTISTLLSCGAHSKQLYWHKFKLLYCYIRDYCTHNLS